MFWAYGSYTAGRVLVLVVVAALARILSPSDFGLVALALIFTSALERFKDLGVSQALVVSDEQDVDERAATAFSFSLMMGVGLSVLCAALSPFAARFFHEPELKRLLPLLGLNFIFSALGSTHYALAQRSINFRARTAGELADVTTRGVTGVVLALLGAGAYSLVGGYLVGTLAMTVVLWLMVDWRPRFRLARRHAGNLVRFGGTLTGVDMAAAAIPLTTAAIIGRVLGATALGYYTLGGRLPEMLIINISLVAGQVLYPAFATIDPKRLGEVFLTALHYTLMIALPMTAFLVVLAEPLILAVFGEKWDQSIPVMMILAPFALAVTLGVPAGTVFKATGAALVLLVMAIPRAVFSIGGVAIIAHQGLVAVATVMAIVTLAFDLLGILVATRLLHVPLRSVVAQGVGPLIATAVMATALYGTNLLIAAPWPTVIAGTLVGSATYFAVLYLVSGPSLKRIAGMTFARGPA